MNDPNTSNIPHELGSQHAIRNLLTLIQDVEQRLHAVKTGLAQTFPQAAGVPLDRLGVGFGLPNVSGSFGQAPVQTPLLTLVQTPQGPVVVPLNVHNLPGSFGHLGAPFVQQAPSFVNPFGAGFGLTPSVGTLAGFRL